MGLRGGARVDGWVRLKPDWKVGAGRRGGVRKRGLGKEAGGGEEEFKGTGESRVVEVGAGCDDAGSGIWLKAEWRGVYQ